MAVQRRGFIFGSFISSIACVLLVLVAIASDNWVVSTFTEQGLNTDTLWYGLFRGQTIERLLVTPTTNTLYMTCVTDLNACAVSCKNNQNARDIEVRALAQGFRPSIGCSSITVVDENDPLEHPPVISFAFYVCLLLMVFLELLFAVIAAGLAILNATTNPTEPVFGLPGCLWSNVISAVVGFAVLMMFGIHWTASGLNGHLAFSMVALGNYELGPGLGYSYWLLILTVLLSLGNVGLLEVRRFLLERDPPPPTIKVDTQSDGTIFLY